MKLSRRNFIGKSALAAAGSLFLFKETSAKKQISFNQKIKNKPIVVSTWNHGLAAN